MTYGSLVVCFAAVGIGGLAFCDRPRSTVALTGNPTSYLVTFAGDRGRDDPDFLAVFDVDPNSGSLGEPVFSVSTGMTGSMPHHAEYLPPPSGEPMFMNAHRKEATLLVDWSALPELEITEIVEPPVPLRFPHDYVRTDKGTLLVSFLRSDGPSPVPDETLMPGNHGGIAEYSSSGVLLRTVSAAVETLDKPIRPYALALLPQHDRLVVTSAMMNEPSWAEVLQIYRYSDFRLLRTIAMPPPKEETIPEGWNAKATAFGLHPLADGSVFLSSYECSLYHLTDIETDDPQLVLVHTIDTDDPDRKAHACGIPLEAGRFWIQPVAEAHTVIVFDISNPRRPVEITRLDTPDDFDPHWLSKDPQSNRLVLGSEMGSEQGFYILRIDEKTGELDFDDDFNGRKPGRFFRMRDRGYVSLEREDWPHGQTGPAWGHAALFLGNDAL